MYGESTVGAGLPILSTLKDLVETGDEIEKIEGVFSGTLSYNFNEFSKVEGGNVKFSEVVKVAKDLGYTVRPHILLRQLLTSRNPTHETIFPEPTLLENSLSSPDSFPLPLLCLRDTHPSQLNPSFPTSSLTLRPRRNT
jgi:hypothetical protein